MSHPFLPRFPVTPELGALLDQRAGVENAWRQRGKLYETPGSGEPVGRSWALERVAGVSRRQVCRWLAEGAIFGDENADRVATALGLHPALLWPAEWWGALPRMERI